MTTITTAALGYPRIGENREWKKLLEQFWSGKLEEAAFKEEMRQHRIGRLQRLQRSSLTLIPVGDFSLYDSMLDHIAAFDLIPSRFRHLGEPDSLAVYFAMARGKEGAPACEMTKWFDTNYHYLVPELGDGCNPRLAFNPWLQAFLEAKNEVGVESRPVLIGPYTFLRLAKGVSREQFAPYIRALLPVYVEVLGQLAEAGATWVQLDEPSLVTNVPAEHTPLLAEIYSALKHAVPGISIMLQTYFGAISQPEAVLALPVDGIGLDFVRGGAEHLALVKKVGWPADKQLGVGIVDGRSIWRLDPERALDMLAALTKVVPIEQITLQTSCSLLHAPVTVRGEASGDPIVRQALAFADEKLEELVQLATCLGVLADGLPVRLQENAVALAALRAHPGRHRAASAADAPIAPRGPYAERQLKQQERFQLPLLPTTTIGSLPQTAEIRKARLDWRRGKLSEQSYRELLNAHMALWIRRQEEMDIDVLVHGEFERTDMVEHFGQLLEGYYFTDNGWVQSYGSRCVKPPIIYGDVMDRGAMTVGDTVYAQSLTERPVKGMLTGPITMLAWSFYRDDLTKEQIADQIARALNAEVLRLEAAGIGMIQVDEPALREIAPLKRAEWPAYLGWAVQSFKRSVAGVRDDTQIHTHMCYCDYHEMIDAIQAMDADVISLETSRSHGELIKTLRQHPYANGIGLGVYDIHSPVVPEVQDMEAVISGSLEIIAPERIWVNPDCGLKTRGEPETLAALRRMVEAAKQARAALSAQAR